MLGFRRSKRSSANPTREVHTLMSHRNGLLGFSGAGAGHDRYMRAMEGVGSSSGGMVTPQRRGPRGFRLLFQSIIVVLIGFAVAYWLIAPLGMMFVFIGGILAIGAVFQIIFGSIGWVVSRLGRR